MTGRCPVDIKCFDQLRHCLAGRNYTCQHRSPYFRKPALDDRVFIEEIMEVLINHRLHPGNDLPFTAIFKSAGLLRHFFKFPHHRPEFQKAGLLQGRTPIGMGGPSFRCRTDEFHHPFIFALGNFGPLQVVPVGLVDHNASASSIMPFLIP